MAYTGEIAGCMQRGGVQRLLHVVYVDEAQDFSPAELTSLMSLCGDSSGVTRRHMSDNQSRKCFLFPSNRLLGLEELLAL